MRRAHLAGAIAAAAILATATAVSATAAPSQEEGADPAVVTLSTPKLPAGRDAGSRARWSVLRERSQGILDRVAAREELDVLLRIPEIGQLVVDAGPGGVGELRRRLSGEPRVEAVQPDHQVELRFTPNDPAFNAADVHAPNADRGQWNVARYGAARAWDLSRGDGAEVAVIDSGFASHPDLDARVAATAGFGLGAFDGGPRTDTLGHGTHVAGLACGDTDNGYGIASLGFDCNFYAEKINIDSLNSCSLVSQAIVSAGDRFSDAISMSLGGCGDSLQAAIDYAWGRGSVLVAAADNMPTPSPGSNYPAEGVQPEGTGPNIDAGEGLVVTAAKYTGERASFAQKTNGVSVAAFGAATDSASGGQQGILSTYPGNTTDFDLTGCQCRTSINGDDRFAYLAGTSMATPQVAGLVALMRAAKPSLPAAKVARLIKLTAGNCAQYANGIGWGVIRADEAVAAALGKDIDVPASNVLRARKARRARLSLRLRSADGACSSELPIAGVKTVNVFASANGGRFHRVGKTKKGKFAFRGKRGRHYRFYSVAVDKAGNREAPPALPDAKARLGRKHK
jgi:serine protease